MTRKNQRITEGHPYFKKHGFSTANLINLVKKCEERGCELTNPKDQSHLGKLIKVQAGWLGPGAKFPPPETFYAELECPDDVNISEIE